MDLERIKILCISLEDYLKKYGDDSIVPSYRIVKSTIEIISSDEETKIKQQEVIQNYKMLFSGKGGLSEFYIWDNDFETRKKLNEPLDKIHEELWSIMKNYI